MPGRLGVGGCVQVGVGGLCRGRVWCILFNCWKKTSQLMRLSGNRSVTWLGMKILSERWYHCSQTQVWRISVCKGQEPEPLHGRDLRTPIWHFIKNSQHDSGVQSLHGIRNNSQNHRLSSLLHKPMFKLHWRNQIQTVPERTSPLSLDPSSLKMDRGQVRFQCKVHLRIIQGLWCYVRGALMCVAWVTCTSGKLH